MVKVPEGWVVVELQELGSIITGKTPSTKQADNFGGNVPFIKPGDLDSGGYISNTADSLSDEGLATVPAIPRGAIAVTCIGTIGKVGIATRLSATNQQINSVIPSELMSGKYLYHYLCTMKPWLEAEASATTVAIINKGKFSKAPVVLAPLAEQKIIADKLDTLLAQVEATKARLEAIPHILKRFRQSVLAAAVSGKLTEEWRNMNSNVEKIEYSTILEARKSAWESTELERLISFGKVPNNDKWKNKYKDPEDVLIDECFSIPESWTWVNLGSVSWSVKDGPHYSPKYAEQGIPFISGGNVSPQGIDFSNCKYISSELHQELSQRCNPNVGDILYTKGGTTGIAYFNQEKRDFNVWVHVAVLKISNVINGKYLQHALNSKHCYNQAQKYTHGVGNQDLGLTRMIKITLPLPPLPEQLEITRHVEQLFAYADTIAEKADAALARVNNLTQSILAQAFRGELTADWRAANPDLISGDNSAEALLAKIKAEREIAKMQPKPKSTTVKKADNSMSKQIIKVVEALKQAGEPLSGQRLLAAAGYPSDSSTEELEQFFLDIRKALVEDKSIIKIKRDDNGQDWFVAVDSVAS